MQRVLRRQSRRQRQVTTKKRKAGARPRARLDQFAVDLAATTYQTRLSDPAWVKISRRQARGVKPMIDGRIAGPGG